MPKTVIASELLRLLPQHRRKEKRTLVLTLDELIDDYRKLHELSPSELDFLLMAYRYEHLFQEFLKKFTNKKIKPEEIIDLWRLAFASLLTRKEESLAQLTHAWVEASKLFFGVHTSSLTNAFCRKVLREKIAILEHAQSHPREILGPTLTQRWQQDGSLMERFARKVLERPVAGIGCLDKNAEWKTLEPKNFHPGEHLAISHASALWMDSVHTAIQKRFAAQGIKVLDACAAPGGKLIALLNRQSNIQDTYAVEAKFKRIQRLKENLAQWQFSEKVRCVQHDWSGEPTDLPRDFDVILADLPCTGLGTLAARPDLLHKDWREKDTPLYTLQETILKNVSQRLTKNGLLFVSICSSDPSEVQHLSQILRSPPSFHAQVSEENTEEITGWVIIKE